MTVALAILRREWAAYFRTPAGWAVLALFLILLGSAAAPIVSGHLAPLFWGGLVALGLVIPLAIDLLGARRVPAVVPAVLVLIGGFVLRYVVVMTHA